MMHGQTKINLYLPSCIQNSKNSISYCGTYWEVAATLFTTTTVLGFIVAWLGWEELRIRAHLSNQPRLVTGRRLALLNGSRRIHNIISTTPLHCGSELWVI